MSSLLTSYPLWLAILSGAVFGLERARPWRPSQRVARPYLWSDLLHIVFNGHFLGVIVYGLYTSFLHAPIVAALNSLGLADVLLANVAARWPIALQIVVAMFAVDFAQWCVHNVLHRVPALWQLHKVHHSIVDGEMDFIVSFRFHWLEVVVYKSALYLPLAFFGFGAEAIFVHAVFGTLIGHLNHANFGLDWGPLRYLMNGPRMHIWHHDYEGDEKTTKNFGIIFSVWDWIFGTAYLPEHPPAKLGYAGVESMPRDFFSHAIWPITPRPRAIGAALGLALIGGLYALSQHGPELFARSNAARPMPEGSSSQPTKIGVAELLAEPERARGAVASLGANARSAGYARPEWMASAAELRAALGAVRLLDVRPAERFAQGHIPTAQNVTRHDYSVSTPIPGLSREGAELIAMLEARGVSAGDVVVLYGDGGAEPYRLWWTLREVLGLEARVLDGGVQAWKALELPTVMGTAELPARGALGARATKRPPLERWQEVVEARAGKRVLLVDTRTVEEFEGAEQDKNAARAGRIPGAVHVSWADFLVSLDDPRLRSPDELRAILAAHRITPDDEVIGYCQSGTRSAVMIYAMLQVGFERAWNYGGSWAEYSRLDAPVETGTN